MYNTNVVVVTNFTKNCTGGAKRAGGGGGAPLALAMGQDAPFIFFWKSDILFYVLYFLTNMLHTIKA